MENNQYPNWVKNSPDKYIPRFEMELALLGEYFTNMAFYMQNDVLLIRGVLITLNLNAYKVEVRYPKTYPFIAPSAAILDADVVNFVKGKGCHEYHHLGVNSDNQGINLCVMRPDDGKGNGWKPEMTGITILNLAAAWLHAYEVKRTTGEWILPE
jgi:hypothetical protein